MRYVILILINIPVVMLALLNLTTKYKLKRTTKNRYQRQLIFWILLFIILVTSFPLYNLINGRPPLESSELSFFDIIQTTAIIALIYIVNNQHQKTEQTEQKLRDLHQELSIYLSGESSRK